MINQNTNKASFHLALPCSNILETKNFYENTLKADIGRSSTNWIDINLYGNQLTFTMAGDFNFMYSNYRFGDKILPSFHFGVILPSSEWENLKNHLLAKDVDFSLNGTFLKQKIGEHSTFLIKDPNGFMVEFKSFKDHSEIFDN